MDLRIRADQDYGPPIENETIRGAGCFASNRGPGPPFQAGSIEPDLDDADTAPQSPATTQAATATTRTAVVGDPERGRQIWEDCAGVIGAPVCSAYHSVDGSEKIGNLRAPTWQGISERAGDLVPGLSAAEYLRESIVDPAAYIVRGYFADSMPKGFKILLSEEDIEGLVAFLLVQ